MFTRSSKPYVTKEEQSRIDREEELYWQPHIDRAENLNSLLLDSSLITPSKTEIYDTKIVQCGKYIQIYKYQRRKDKNKKDIEKMKDQSRVVYNIMNVDTDNLIKIEKEEEKKEKKKNKKIELKKIENKNVNRSKFQLQRIVKSNEEIFKTFITLTFANFEKVKIDNKEIFYWLCPNVQIPFNINLLKNHNIVSISNKLEFNKKIENYTSISKANVKFDNWRSNLKKRLKNDFIYICVPEFQKNGTVHYHLLTNIDYTDFNILSKDEKKIFKPKKGWQIFRTLKSWCYGYSSVINIKSINIVGYMSKYMTKDIDNRLFGHRRYLCSQCLSKPSTIFLDSEFNQNKIDKLIYNSDPTFSNIYSDLNGLVIEFNEYKLFDELNIDEVLS